MKKILASLVLLTGFCCIAMAVPARPGTFKYTQPDGSVIELQRHGDEFFNWTTDMSGQVVALGEDGFYHPSTIDFNEATEAQHARHQTNEQRRRSLAIGRRSQMTVGERHIPVILMDFPDVHFSIDSPVQQFNNLLNQVGYQENGAFGSVRDYYYENSHGAFTPVFDIYGPVTVSKNVAAYHFEIAKGSNAPYAIAEAARALDGVIDFSQYDYDNNGWVDMMLVYYPGHNPAEGGPSNHIWPHQWSVAARESVTLDGKRLGSYFCSSELKGYSGVNMCGIGTTCHEFAHSLGLPDFYDTDYEGSGGENVTTGYFDLMCSGNYNDNNRRPPYLSAIEREMLGWMETPSPISGAGDYTLLPISENQAYTSTTPEDGEFFVYEYRAKNRWDEKISSLTSGGGLLIYHVDQSDHEIDGWGVTGRQLWNANYDINIYYGHPCYYLKQTPENSYMYFPSPENVTTYSPDGWYGSNGGITLSSIAVDGTKATFTISANTTHVLRGHVTTQGDLPVEGATMVLSKAKYSFNAAPLSLSTDITTTTDAQGNFSFDLAGNNQTQFVLSVRKNGYVSQARNVTFALDDDEQSEDFTLGTLEGNGSLADNGVSYINMEGDVPSVVLATDKSAKSISWSVDGQNVLTPTAKASLAAGTHVYMATITYYDGTSERIYYFVNKE